MKLISWREDGAVHLGAARPGGVVDLRGAVPAGMDMVSLIGHWDHYGEHVAAAVAQQPPRTIDSALFVAPIARPGKIMAIGLNYADHAAESGMPMPQKQLWFSKAVTSVNGPFAPIALPRVSQALDYEAELVAVIGRRARHVPAEQAASVVFGYCAGNDVTVRDWQRHSTQFVVGKSFDTHAPFGPWIATADEVGDPHTLDIRCRVNGELRQQSNTRHLIFNIYEQIAYLSAAMTLEPGDLIFTGTPGGVGSARKPPLYLRAGDRVQVEIERVGAIESLVVAEDDWQEPSHGR